MCTIDFEDTTIGKSWVKSIGDHVLFLKLPMNL
jgi:hypothetical protein